MNIRKITAALLITAMMVIPVTATAAGPDPADDLIERFKSETCCDHVSVCIYDNGNITYYGDSSALYQIGSMTKAFTGLAVQKLICDGLISEDDVISDHIPGYKAVYEGAEVDITIHNLLTQTSGYTNNEKDYPSATGSMTLTEWADTISGLPLRSRPGTEYAYSNVNFNLLGLIIENVTGDSYRYYMENKILKPLGLEHTYVGMPDNASVTEGTRLGYRHTFEFPLEVREASIPAGYFYSDAEDMAGWIGIWTGDAPVPEEFAKPLAQVKSNLADEGDYYSGWELFADDVIGHSGGTPNYSSRIVFSEDKHTGVCVLTALNVAATTDSLCNSLMDMTCGSAYESGALARDIWTVFDLIFTAVTFAGIALLIAGLLIRKRAILITIDVSLIILLALMIILFPVIFEAGLASILFTWAPWSLAGGMLVIAADITVLTIILFTGKKNADRNETGGGTASHRHNRISRVQ